MSERNQIRMLFHGAIVLFIGLVFGLPFGVALAAGWGDASVRSWRVAHSGIVAVGLMLTAIGASLGRLALGDRVVSVLVWSLVASAYGFTLALLLGAVAGVRGYQPAGPALNLVAFVANLTGVLGALLGVALVIRGAYASLKASTAD